MNIRTLWPSDREIEQEFVRGLSAQTRYYRFHSGVRELSPAMLERFINVNYPDEMALAATIEVDDREVLIGVARYMREPGKETAEMAIVVADAWQAKGIGTRLLLDLRSCAIAAGVKRMNATVLSENRRMYELAKRLGYEVEPRHGDYRTVELGKEFDRVSYKK
ncbi:MAG: GNAT family N-acetyltransferase [Pseudomonadales bacterium]|nr:GNAT family N-acetyltransferase [Pseudomonadales bacterium]